MTDLALPADLTPAPTTVDLLPTAGLTRDQVELLKTTICKDATDDELRLFVAVCNSRRLNPFTGQIHFVKRRTWNAKLNGGEGGFEEIGSHQTGIDGYRLIADRTGRYEGRVGIWWCGPDGKWRDVWLEDKPPAAAKVAVQRRGFAKPTEAIARWKAYVQTKRNGQPNAMWSRMDAEQLAKCAEALALRTAFPEELSGIYTTDEMAQAGNPGSGVDTTTGEVLAERTQDHDLWADDMPTAWAIENVRDPEDARWLLQQPEVSDDYREAVKRVVEEGNVAWPAFWRSASTGHWQTVLTKATQQSGAGLMANAADYPANASPVPDPKSPPAGNEQEAAAPMTAHRSPAGGSNHDGKPGADPETPHSGDAAMAPGPTPPGPGATTSPAGSGAKGAHSDSSARGRQSKPRESHGAAAGRTTTEGEGDQSLPPEPPGWER